MNKYNTNNPSPSVTIGIPAYNEEMNIKNLLNSLIKQKKDDFNIERILVVSDGSDDRTIEIASQIIDTKISLVDSKTREGKPKRMNQIFSMSKTDIVVILDADIRLSDDCVILNLIKPLISDKKIMSSSGNAAPLPPITFAQKIAYAGTILWDRIISSEYASQLYLSEGRIRAFKKKVYQEMRFPESSADEAFSFLYCAKNNFPFVYVEKALVYYNLPESFAEYIKQCKRFLKSSGIQESNYDRILIEKYYTIDWKIKIKFLLNGIFKNTFWTLLYLCTIPITRMLFLMDKKDKEVKWDMISSSKNLDRSNTKKKVFFSTYDSVGNPHYGGGGALAIHETAKRLAGKYKITVICGKYPHAKNRTIDNVSYKHTGSGIFGAKIGQLIFQMHLPAFVLFCKFDIWIESFTPPFSTSFLQFFTKKPVIGLVHMLSAEDMLRKYKLPFYVIENLGIRTYNHFIVLTDNMFNKIRKINAHSHIEVIPNGIDIPELQKINNKEYFLFIGRIEIDQKGLDLLLKSYKLISDRTRFPLLIAGNSNDHEKRKLISMIKDAGLGDKARVIGRVEGKEKSELFQNALAVIIPSRYETFSMIALESLSYGIPVVAFDIEGLSWIPDKFCRKIKPFDICSLSQAMDDMSENRKYTDARETELHKFLDQYNWSDISNKYDRYINNAINASK